MAKQSKAIREPIATWWKIDRWKAEIQPVKVVAFTAAFVTYISKRWSFSKDDLIEERREKRDDIFPTFAEAKAEMLSRATKALEASKQELQRDRSYLGQVESLVEPKP